MRETGQLCSKLLDMSCIIVLEKLSSSKLFLEPNEYVTMDYGLKDLDGYITAVIWLFYHTGCGYQCLQGIKINLK